MRQTYTTGVLTGSLSVGIIIGLFCYGILIMDDAADRSAVDYPMGSIIRDIRMTLEAADCELAKAKIVVLEDRWNEHKKGGMPPEGFQGEIKQLNLSAPP